MEKSTYNSLPRLWPRIGGMATMPSRIESCRKALPHILAQIDRLYLYLDKYTEIPEEFSRHPKVVPLLPAPGDNLNTSGKFVGLEKTTGHCLYFCFDDDIFYPPSYVAHLSAALQRHGYRALVGFHAAVYKFPINSYIKDRHILHFCKRLDFDCCVDELGTGTLAFHSKCITFDFRRWERKGNADLMFMIEAVRQGVPRMAVQRPANFLQAIAEDQPDSLYRLSRADDSMQTRLLQSVHRLYPGRWCRSG